MGAYQTIILTMAKYKGLREHNGVWEEFEAEDLIDASPKATGYVRVQTEAGEEVTDGPEVVLEETN